MTNKPQRRIAVPPSDVATPFPILMRLPDLRPERDYQSPNTTQPAMSAAVSLAATEVPIAANMPALETPIAESARELIAAFAAEKKSATVEVKNTLPPTAAYVESADLPAAAITEDAPSPQPATVVAQSISVANEAEPEAVPTQSSVDEANVEEATVAPAAARRQRALERSRRHEPTSDEPRSWWTSHAPVIAVSFLLGLAVTVMFARSNRDRPSPEQQARLEPETQELSIEIGAPTKVPPSMAVSSAVGDSATASNAGSDAVSSPASGPPSKSKLPPLLGAKPALASDAAAPLAMPIDPPAPTVAANVSASPAGAGQPDDEADNSLPVLESANTSYPVVDNDSYIPGDSTPRTARTVDTMPSDYPVPTIPNARR